MAETSSLAQNLRRLRDAKKLSQAAVADKAKLSRVAYGSIEAGSASPRVDTLMRIADALDVKLQELLVPSRTLTAVRFRAAKKMTSREQVLVDVARWLDDYNELEDMLDDHIAFKLDKIARSYRHKTGDKRAIEAAGVARKALGLQRDDEGIRDICGLLQERAGIKVYPYPLASDGFFGLSVGAQDGGPAVVVNMWDRIPVERWIFTAAHELGHLLLHLSAFDVSRSDENKTEEHEADRFASHFLMPDAVFKSEWNEARGLSFVDRVLKIKRIFKVSYRTVLYRLRDHGASQDIWMQFQVAYARRAGHTLKKTDEPGGLGPSAFDASMVETPTADEPMSESRAADEPKRLSADDFVEDRLSRLVRTAIDQQQISVSRGAEILGLDLREMRERVASWID
jgi:Zn-dependent peptidase ImmA (M78 family)/DNA-binding XRE family transcriptional regulator